MHDMSFWKLIARVWPWSNARGDGRGESIRVPSLDKLNEPDVFEDRNVPSVVLSTVAVPECNRSAEVIHVSLGQQLRQYTVLQGRRFQVYVVAVDYLLEHEWFWLLTGQHRPPAYHTGGSGEPGATTYHGLWAGQFDSNAQQSRTVCANGFQWSVATSIGPTSPGSPTKADP
jgi:hypothetical protein